MTTIQQLREIANHVRSLPSKHSKKVYLEMQSREVLNFLGGNINLVGIGPEIFQEIQIGQTGGNINLVGIGPEIFQEIQIGQTNVDLNGLITAFDVASKVSSSTEKRIIIKGVTLSQAEKDFVGQALYSIGRNLQLGVSIQRVSEGIEDAIAPMLAANKPFNINDCFVEEKFNGHRLVARRIDDDIFLHSRNGKPIDSPKIAEALLDVLPENTIVDGEIIASNRDFEDLHVKSDNVRYKMFDIVTIDGRDIKAKPLAYRRDVLEEMVPNKYVGVSELLDFKNFEEIDAWINKTHSEGIVAKLTNEPYNPGKRSWFKRKLMKTLSAKITGMTEGTGKRKGLLGAVLIIPEGLTEVTKCGSGFTDEELISISKRLSAGEQLQCDVQFQSITKAGRLQFPVFLRLR
jgi:ATP-dependent DNA ligase